MEQLAATFLQMGFSFWVAWYALTKLKPTIENNTKAITILISRMGIDMKKEEQKS
jgi:hypothetical protein